MKVIVTGAAGFIGGENPTKAKKVLSSLKILVLQKFKALARLEPVGPSQEMINQKSHSTCPSYSSSRNYSLPIHC